MAQEIHKVLDITMVDCCFMLGVLLTQLGVKGHPITKDKIPNVCLESQKRLNGSFVRTRRSQVVHDEEELAFQ